MSKYNLVVSKLLLNCATLLNRRDLTPKAYHISKDGYAVVRLYNSRKIVAVGYHQAVFMLHHMRPTTEGLMIDHKDRNRLNNDPENLREVTALENRHNSSVMAHDPNKYVRFEKDRNRWAAFVKVDGVKVRLGRFKTEEEAREARINAIDERGLRTANT